MKELTINPEIAKMLRKQTEAERRKLEALILRDGIQDPVIVWEETGEILDGHNRVDIAAGNNADGEVLDYSVEEVSLESLDAAIEYVLERQEGKRNATPQDLSYSRGKLYERRKKDPHSRPENTNAEKRGAQNAQAKGEATSEKLGAESGVDQATIRRDAEYSRAVDALTEVFGKDFEAHVLSGESKLSKGDVVMLAGELGKDDDLLYSASELWAFGKVGTFKLAHLLARCHRECGLQTHEALWEQPDDSAKVRHAPSQLNHLLKLASTGNEDSVTADLVALAESGVVRDVFKAHDQRQKERKEAEREDSSEQEKAVKKFEDLQRRLYELAQGIEDSGGLSRVMRNWPEQNQRIYAERHRELGRQIIEQAREFQTEKGGDLN